MPDTSLAKGTVHTLPKDMREALQMNKKARVAWNDLTPLARNEWICWTISVQKAETRAGHLTRMLTELGEGKRRPCCWIGCIHRTDKTISPSVQGVLKKKRR